MKKLLLMSAMICFGATAPATVSADPVEDAIKSRLGFYNMTRHYFGGLVGMAKGDVEYDAAKAQEYADVIAYLAQVNTDGMWPEGSSNVDRPGLTRSLPTIWSDYDGVVEHQQDWIDTSITLQNTVAQGLPELRAGLDGVNQACTACHDQYRAKDF
ncbi:c-type cytochrome [Tateyamaria sp. SN3-11]|uniref:c-type cytochrome n=1 Tax=Tateyamaria sp. SN3-11 TaxID=3092147 RepID=UPI0039EBD9FE